MIDYEQNPVGARILVADDEEPNRVLLAHALEAEGYVVTHAADGEQALAAIAEHHPDTVLLDIMMPGLDGVEVCRRVKADPATAHLPILLVTAQRSRAQRLEGIAAGATDFISKPVDLDDLRLRVVNAVRTKRLHDRVRAEYDRVQTLESLRDNLVHMIVHDLRSPITSIQGALEVVEWKGKSLLTPSLAKLIGAARESSERVIDLVQSVLDVNRLEAEEMPLHRDAVDLQQLLQDVQRGVGPAADRVQVTGGRSVIASCDPDLTRRVVRNLVANGLEYSPAGEPVCLAVERRDDRVRVTVADRGPGIPAHEHAAIFDKFGQVEGTRKHRKASTGIGLAFCQLAVTAHGGTIGVDSVEGQGATFWFELPVDPPKT